MQGMRLYSNQAADICLFLAGRGRFIQVQFLRLRWLLRWIVQHMRTLIFQEAIKMDYYSGKSVLITGGSSGIGLAIARDLVKRGSKVILLARRQNLLEEAYSELTTIPGIERDRVVLLQADVTREKELKEILNQFMDANGIPEIVINSAGVSHPGTFTSLKPEIFHWLMDVNYFGTVNVLKTIVPRMQKQRSGVIVNISSVAGFIGLYGYTAYSASKYAVSGFSDALRSELKPYGIQVSIVFPPDTKTPQLEYEDKFKPFITRELAGTANLLSADVVARDILKQVARGKYIILPGTEGKILYLVKNLIGKSQYPIMDLMVKDAIRKIKLGV